MGKRKNEDSHKHAVQSLLGIPNVADMRAREIYNTALAAVGREDEQLRRTDWTKFLDEAVPSTCFQSLELPSVKAEDGAIHFPVANVGKLLQAIVNNCPNFAEKLQKAIATKPGTMCHLICYHDEATGGNLLFPDSGKKAFLFYFAIKELMMLEHDTMWRPLAMIQHTEASRVQGGFGHVFHAVVKALLEQQLQHGVPLRFNTGCVLFFCKIHCWIGDLDAIRISLDSKGSSGLRVCFRCKNILKRDANVTVIDPYFREVSCSDTRLFDPQTDADVFAMMDDMLAHSARWSKSHLQRKEMTTGFVLNPFGILANIESRRQCPPSMWLFDVMHLYYSCGLISWEIVLFLEAAKKHNVTLQILQDVFKDTDWRRSKSSPNSVSWRAELLNEHRFSGDAYRGSTLDLMALFPLLFFTCANYFCRIRFWLLI